jgi:hypothetical protein
MRTGRPKQPLIVTEEERQRLESLAHRARSQAVLARRAQWYWLVRRDLTIRWLRRGAPV